MTCKWKFMVSLKITTTLTAALAGIIIALKNFLAPGLILYGVSECVIRLCYSTLPVVMIFSISWGRNCWMEMFYIAPSRMINSAAALFRYKFYAASLAYSNLSVCDMCQLECSSVISWELSLFRKRHLCFSLLRKFRSKPTLLEFFKHSLFLFRE